MQLSDVDILDSLEKGEIQITDFDIKRLQPASYDVLLGFDFMYFTSHELSVIDPKEDVSKAMKKYSLKSEEDFFVLHPGEFALASTYDRVGVGPKHAMQLMGKSSLARLGLLVHTTAGFIDPGNNLNITLELVNTNVIPIKLYPKMKIAQVAVFELKTPCQKPYGHKDLNSKYYQATTVQASKMHKNY